MTEDRCFEDLRAGGLEGTRAKTWDLKEMSLANHPVSGFPLSGLESRHLPPGAATRHPRMVSTKKDSTWCCPCLDTLLTSGPPVLESSALQRCPFRLSGPLGFWL